MFRRTYQISRKLLSISMLVGVWAAAGCGGTEVVELGDTLNGTCVNCHQGISAVHPLGAAVSCVNCHGGNATALPFQLAGVEDLLETFDPDAEQLFNDVGGRFVPINPTKLADQNAAPFNNGPDDVNGNQIGRYDATFQVLLTAAHNLPKGCAGPPEIVDVNGNGVLDRVHINDLTPQQQADLAAGIDSCHAVFFWVNGMDDDGDGLVDETGEFSLLNPADPIGIQYEFDKIDLDGDGVINAAEANDVDITKTKTLRLDLRIANVGEVDIPVKLGQNIDSEFGMDVNYVRFMNPGDSRTAAASCGRKSRASQFAGNCHDLETDIVRRSIMSYMSGVLAGAIYANGSIPNSRSLTDENGNTDRNVADLRDGRIAYLQNYDSLDEAFDPVANRFVLEANAANGATKGLRNVFLDSLQNQVRLNEIFDANLELDNNGDDIDGGGAPLNTNGLEQDDCNDAQIGNANTFRGNLCHESYPEELFRVDNTVIAGFEAAGFEAEDALEATTLGGTATAGHGKDLAPNRNLGNRLVFDQFPLQDKQRSLFILTPIPRRTLTGASIVDNQVGNQVFFGNAQLVGLVVTGQANIANLLIMPNAPDITQNIQAGGVLDERQFSRLAGINPVDTALQTFRPFHSLSFPNITGDFFFFDEQNLLDNNANNDVFVLRNNPHGRARGSGCSSCHMPYDQDGVSRELNDPTVRLNGKQPGDIMLGKSFVLNSGLSFRTIFDTNVNENGTAQATSDIDINEIANNQLILDRVLGALGNPDELPRLTPPTGMDDFGRERFYPSLHKITTQITSQMCERCHAFVTRVGFAAFGRHENEGGMDFINWYTWTPRDSDGDNRITHRFVANNNGVADNGADLGRFINNRGAAPEQDFLEFKNAVDPNQLVRIFNNLPAFDGTNGRDVLLNTGDRFTEDLNNNGLLDFGEDRSNLAAGNAMDIPDRAGRTVVFDGRQQRIVYGGASGAVLLQDKHFESGMHCIDCHFLTDSHGEGNLYARNWDVVGIKCVSCHGDGDDAGTLKLLGPNGGQDLTKSKDQFGVPFFEVGRKGERIQRSRVVPGREWRIPQVIDAINPKSDDFNPDAAEAMAVLDQAGNNAHIPSNIVDEFGIERVGVKKLECSACHSSWTPNCFTCHMDFDYGQTVGEIWVTQNRNPISFFQLFTIIRSPFILAFGGSNERNRIMTQRSLMELHPNVTLNTGDALVENFTFTSARGVSGLGQNQYMAHTVRTLETKDCDTCHTVTPNDLDGLQALLDDGASPFDDILNNNILAQTLGLGSGRLNEPGDFFFAGSEIGLEAIDTKAEVRRAIDDDGDGSFVNTAAAVRNTFQGFRGLGFGSGFLVASAGDAAVVNAGIFNFGAANGRSFTNAVAGGLTDVVFIRNYVDATEEDPNSTQLIGAVRAMDIVVGANGNSLSVRIVTDRTGAASAAEAAVGVGAGNDFGGTITAIDHPASDMSSQFVYVVTNNGNIAIADLRRLINPATNIAGVNVFAGFNRAGFNGNVVAATNNIGGDLRDIELEGNFAFVLNNNNGNGASLQAVFARQLRFIDRVVNDDPVNQQVAADFLLETPGDLEVKGEVDLGCNDARRVAIMNVMAYVACGADGLVVVNIEDPTAPRVIAQLQDSAVFDFDGNGNGDGQSNVINGGLDDAQGVFAMDNRLFIANGNQDGAGVNEGIVMIDVTSPKNPIPVHTFTKAGALAIVDPVDIIAFVEPGEQWLFVSDSVGRAHAINVTEPYNIRVRLGEHAAAAKGLIDDDVEVNGAVPGFRPVSQLAPFASQALLEQAGGGGANANLADERPFFEFTNVRFTLDLRDPTTPNDPANIDDLILNQPHIISFALGGGGDVRLAQTQDLDAMADWSGYPERDSWASGRNLNTACETAANGDIQGIEEDDPLDASCASEDVNDENLGELGARPLDGPSFRIQGNELVLVRGQMDVMRGVFVREVNGVDLDGNGLGNLECVAVGIRGDGFKLNSLLNCQDLYPKQVADELFKNKKAAKSAAQARK